MKQRISVFLNDKERKPILKIIKEAIVFWFVKKELPFLYFGKFLYRKNVTNYTDYLSSKEVDEITLSKKMHQYQYASILRNKLSFAVYMEYNGLPVPKLIGYNLNTTFFYKKKGVSVTDTKELHSFFSTLFETEMKDEIFIKSIKDMGGNGCFLVRKDTLKKQLEKYGDYLLSNDCIYQEVVIQHDDINKIYPHSINTLRFDSYIDKKGTIHILSAFMRFGAGGSVIDNGSSGGYYLSVNMEKGVLSGETHQLMKYGGNKLKAHPDTEVVFDEYKIPFFEEACELIKKAVIYIPDRIIGWDIAISNKGPVIIEGNDNNSFITPDIAYGGYLKHPLFKEIMNEVK